MTASPAHPSETGPAPGLLVPAVLLSCAGVFLCSLDSSLNVAFPDLTRHFRLAPRDLTAVIALYHVPIALMTMIGGTAGDRFTHARVFICGIALTALALPLCALAPSYAAFLASRILQGAGAGLVFGSAPALVALSLSGHQRTRGLGLMNSAAAGALALAPAVAGLAITIAGWTSVFWFRVPIAIALVLVAARWRPTHPTAASSSRRLTTPPPLLPALSVPLLVSDALNFLANSALIVLYVLGPLFLSEVLGASAVVSGLLFTVLPLGTAVGALASGLLARRASSRALTLVGLGLESAGLFALSSASTGGEGRVVLGFALAGLGLGTFQVPNMATVLALMPSTSQGFGGGMISTMRTLGIVVGAILSPRVFESRLTIHSELTGHSSRTIAAAFADVLSLATVVAVSTFGLALVGAPSNPPLRGAVSRSRKRGEAP